jgi:SagB-type dehydrogenase family enzyme
LRAPAPKSRRAAPPILATRLSGHIALEPRAGGELAASFDGYSVSLGTFSDAAVKRAQDLRAGLPFASFTSSRRSVDKEIDLLVHRLARHGFVEYGLRRARENDDLVVIEPQLPDYWPRIPKLGSADVFVLSRFAYMRRRGSEMVLESPRAGALFRICDPKVAATIAVLSTPQKLGQLRKQVDFPGAELLALLVDCQILFKITAAGDAGLRTSEGDDTLVLWDFHDLLFHARSTQGRHANLLGGVYPYAGTMPALPAVRPHWPGKRIDLRPFSDAPSPAISPLGQILRERHSTRSFDDGKPIALAEISRFLDNAARVLSRSEHAADLGDGGPIVEYTARPYPSAGAEYELELYLAVDRCAGLARGFYHYDAGDHALVAIEAPNEQLDALLMGAAYAMAAPAPPQIVIMIAARFGRVSWKYSSIAYSLILKDVGVLMQTLYLIATDMGLGGCAIGTTDIDLFAKMTGIEFHVEGPVGQFALGRGAPQDATD